MEFIFTRCISMWFITFFSEREKHVHTLYTASTLCNFTRVSPVCNLATTLSPPHDSSNSKVVPSRWQGCDMVVTRLCHGACNNLVTRLLQLVQHGGYNLVIFIWVVSANQVVAFNYLISSRFTHVHATCLHPPLNSWEESFSHHCIQLSLPQLC